MAEILPEVGIEPAHLSQQLAVLRRANLVTSRKEGSSVRYSLTSPHVAELLAVARLILTGVLSGQAELLDDLRASAGGSGRWLRAAKAGPPEPGGLAASAAWRGRPLGLKDYGALGRRSLAGGTIGPGGRDLSAMAWKREGPTLQGR